MVFDNEDGIIDGIIYFIVTILIVMVLILALGPVIFHIESDMYGTLDQEDTIFRGNDGGWNGFNASIFTSIDVWEASLLIFIFIAALYMFMRAIKKQTYTQQGEARYR